MKMGKLTGEDEIAVEMLVALEDYSLDIVMEYMKVERLDLKCIDQPSFPYQKMQELLIVTSIEPLAL